MVSAESLSDLVKKYDELLEGKYSRQMSEEVMEVNRKADLRFRDGLPVCRALRPHFLSSAVYAETMRAAEVVSTALHRLSVRAGQDESLRRRLGVPAMFDEFLRLDPNPEVAPLWLRLDGFRSGDGPARFIEANPFPGSFVESELLGDYFAQSAILRELSEYRFRSVPLMPALLRSIQNQARMPADRMPTLGFIKGVPIDFPPDKGTTLIENFLTQNGFELIHGGLEEASLRGGKLHLRDRPVDMALLYPEPVLYEMTEGSRLDMMRTAIVTGAVRLMIGPAVSLITHNKGIFEVLTDEAEAGFFGAETFAELQRSVPWTRAVREGKVRFEGREQELLELLRARREEFVLKPCFGQNGVGVMLGWTTTPAQWDEALKMALGTPHVAQRRVSVEHGVYPLLGPSSTVEWSEVSSDLDPYLWDGQAEGCLVRLSSNDILNVAMGGAITPMIVVD